MATSLWIRLAFYILWWKKKIKTRQNEKEASVESKGREDAEKEIEKKKAEEIGRKKVLKNCNEKEWRKRNKKREN